jgi:hypothetical protein
MCPFRLTRAHTHTCRSRAAHTITFIFPNSIEFPPLVENVTRVRRAARNNSDGSTDNNRSTAFHCQRNQFYIFAGIRPCAEGTSTCGRSVAPVFACMIYGGGATLDTCIILLRVNSARLLTHTFVAFIVPRQLVFAIFAIIFVTNILGRAQIFCARAQWQSCARAQKKIVRLRSRSDPKNNALTLRLRFFLKTFYRKTNFSNFEKCITIKRKFVSKNKL